MPSEKDTFNKIQKFSDYSETDEYKQRLDEYLNSEEYKSELENIHKSVRKKNFNKVISWIKNNILSLIALVVAFVSLFLQFMQI